ncbi:hypothetical protein [Rhodopirellula europaea]|uniref:hypothetical protein n=1 Tax=Rhodopirellula europaea TaxID=1263866 RepID=UPI000587A999|nr:hypothetical protein [Rhodopirellula europaea]
MSLVVTIPAVDGANHGMHGRTACAVFEVESLSSAPRDAYRYRMQDVSPYQPPETAVDRQPELHTSGNKRIAAKTARAASVAFLAVLGGGFGLVTGVLAGFYGGFAIFGHAGDFTMMFVAPCILIGASVGAALGTVGGALVGRSIASNTQRG